MKPIKRYDPYIQWDCPAMKEEEDGEWVSYVDYKKLEDKINKKT